ncbi:MAG TPA: tyrosine-protein phosphatase [Steroidobacteraceae bacterium]|jgi:protein-tyrosine phosphatase|nr:tyrosine-protein phosphatase [Steroidobacteraceae bacterium]
MSTETLTSSGGGPWPQVRVLPLQGGRNFRDLGGYRAADGRHIKWGVLFRSGSLIDLTRADWQHLMARGVQALCDFRSTRERQTEPVPLSDYPNLSYFARDYHTSFADLRALMRTGFGTAAAAREAMLAGFRELPFDQAAGYRQLFAYLKSGRTPLVFNCSAGKDRAGTAAALVLSALGVPRATVIEDFALTNEVLNLREALLKQGRDLAMDKHTSLAKQPVDVITAIVHADPEYIATALDSIDTRHGSMEGYLRELLDVSDAELQRLRDTLLE